MTHKAQYTTTLCSFSSTSIEDETQCNYITFTSNIQVFRWSTYLLQSLWWMRIFALI